MEAGVKYDTGKRRYDLLPTLPLQDLVDIYTFGAQKYEDHNWRRGIVWSRVFAAVMRHLWAFWGGENLDPESGMPHLAHAAWGMFTLLEYMRTYREGDDRFPNTGSATKEPETPKLEGEVQEQVPDADDINGEWRARGIPMYTA